MPVHRSAGSENMIRTTGTYVDDRPLIESHWRTSTQFGPKGDVLAIDSIIDGSDQLVVHSWQGWYTVLGDSVRIEYFCRHPDQMYAMELTQVGVRVNDTTLRMAYTDRPLMAKDFVFVPVLVHMPEGDPMYARKKWYNKRLHPSRR